MSEASKKILQVLANHFGTASFFLIFKAGNTRVKNLRIKINKYLSQEYFDLDFCGNIKIKMYKLFNSLVDLDCAEFPLDPVSDPVAPLFVPEHVEEDPAKQSIEPSRVWRRRWHLVDRQLFRLLLDGHLVQRTFDRTANRAALGTARKTARATRLLDKKIIED